MNREVQKYLLDLARSTIAEKFGKNFSDRMRSRERPEDKILEEKRGVFVTLTIGGDLRGCIGNIMPVYPLEEGVKRNALNAAFDDPRFEPLSEDEFEKIDVEISVLSVPKKLEYSDSEDLLRKLKPLRDGVIIESGPFSATYLPQVWEEIKDKEMFLSTLCMKAGLPADEWKTGSLDVSVYQAEVFTA